ncbi:DoxX family protein [Streptomyces sp. Ag109_G2-15]|uniref:DoxX family protein n=1 Tax=Streptomyces sp. Ag109_G2-15 TaxID=1938850 RepID=UPI000BD9FE36|nr:DoxX family protein [Streptomyces sp. Ag109_G2-15]SOD87329.1 DoxX-like family protein [Streptomyces sp. Ag109_G2-15]
MSETTAPATSAPSTASVTARGRLARIALRTVQVLLALFYGTASALPKLIAHPSAVESFDKIGWGSAGMYTIGALELAGAIALLVPVLQSVAAIALSALMVGAFIVQLSVFDGQYAATPLILIVPLALIAWSRRGHNTELLRLLGRAGRQAGRRA